MLVGGDLHTCAAWWARVLGVTLCLSRWCLPFAPQFTAILLRKVGSALVLLHSLGVAHRDVKPANVLFTDTARRDVKLCDFGFALCCGGRRIKSVCGSPAYMAPEIWKRESYEGAPVDVWALGSFLYEVSSTT